MGRVYKTPFLMRSCDVHKCDLGADFTIKNASFTPIGYICAKHAFLLKVGGKIADFVASERQKEFAIEDGDEVALPGADDEPEGNA